jgi:hypothetical protein
MAAIGAAFFLVAVVGMRLRDKDKSLLAYL